MMASMSFHKQDGHNRPAEASELLTLGFYNTGVAEEKRMESARLRVVYHEEMQQFELQVQIHGITVHTLSVATGLMDDENAVIVAKALNGFCSWLEGTGTYARSLLFRRHWPALMKTFIAMRAKAAQPAADTQMPLAAPSASPLVPCDGAMWSGARGSDVPATWPQACNDVPSPGCFFEQPSSYLPPASSGWTPQGNSTSMMETVADVDFSDMDTDFADIFSQPLTTDACTPDDIAPASASSWASGSFAQHVTCQTEEPPLSPPEYSNYMV